MSNYHYKQYKGHYVIYDGNNILRTPGGHDVTTLYKKLAVRIILDLNRYGMNYRSASSILSWHFTMIDNFAPMEHESIEQIMSYSFLTKVDWTCIVNYGSGWSKTFGQWIDRQKYIEQWLSKATLMQMTAACCIGNAYESLNLALVLALILEKYDANERDLKLREVAHQIASTYQFGIFDDIYNDFKTFELYYGIHLDENGKLLDTIVPDNDDANEEDYFDEDEEIDVDCLNEFSVTIEQLVGRNFYHYTDYEPDKTQPMAFDFSEFELNVADEESDVTDFEDEESDDEDEDEYIEDLSDYLPDDCWVKRFVDDDNPNTFYYMYIVLDEDGKIEDSGCIEESSSSIGGGGFLFMISGMEMSSTKSYDFNSYPPEKVTDDLRLLFQKRTMPLDFSFIGKRLPQAMIDEGGNGGSDTEYTYSMQSAFRLAYMHMSIDTTKDGIVKGFSYSTYQSSGSAYGDMFSRPTCILDRKDEAIDMLLDIYDMYTDEEIKEI